MDISIRAGLTSKRIAVYIRNASTGEGLTGLLFSSTGLVWYFWREDQGNVAATSITLATATRGTWATGGFIEKDATNMKGWYELSIPDAVLATGSGWAKMRLEGAVNMIPIDIAIELDGVKNVALSEITQAAPSVNPTYDYAMMLLYMMWCRSEVETTDTEYRVKNNAGTVILKRTLDPQPSVFTKEELVIGP